MAVTTSGPTDKPIGDKKPVGRGGQAMGVKAGGQKAVTKYLQKQRPSVTKRPGAGSADAMERSSKAAKAGKNSFGRSQGAINSAATQEEDWLAALLGGGGGGGGVNTAAAQAAMAAQRAKMEALYKRYAEDIAAQEAGINTNYQTSATNLGGIYDTAVGNVNKSYDAARAAQNQQLLALGMTEQTPVQSFGNQTGATTSFENLRAAVLAQNEASRKNAITNQKLAAEGATREGVDKLSAYDAQVAQALAEMQSSGGGGGGGGGLSAKDYANLKLRQMGMDQDAQIAAAKLAAANQPRPQVDVNALLNQAKAQGMTTAEATNYVKLFQ
jgi:hypothetical protein